MDSTEQNPATRFKLVIGHNKFSNRWFSCNGHGSTLEIWSIWRERERETKGGRERKREIDR